MTAVATQIDLEAAMLDQARQNLTRNEKDDLFRLYWAAEISERTPSEADAKLFRLLALGGIRDPDQLERIGRGAWIAGNKVDIYAAGRLVETQDRTKKWARADYVRRTVDFALRTTEDEYKKRQAISEYEAKHGSGTADLGPFESRTLGEWAANPELLKEPEQMSPWLVWCGELTVLVGREKLAGKSTLAASDATQAAKSGRRVLWLTVEEGPNRVVSRFHALGAPADRVLIPKRWPRTWDEVEELIANERPDCVYVDSLGSFVGVVTGKVPDTSEGEAWQALVGRFKTWTTLGAGGVCLLLHATKADGSYRGSTGIGAAVDTILTMRAVDDDVNARKLEAIGRWGFPTRFVRFTGDKLGYVPMAASELPASAQTNQEQRLMFDTMGKEEWTVLMLSEALGWPKETTRDQLTAAGDLVTRRKGARRAWIYRRTGKEPGVAGGPGY